MTAARYCHPERRAAFGRGAKDLHLLLSAKNKCRSFGPQKARASG